MTFSRVVCASLLVGGWLAVASAQPVADHLKCYKVKDTETKATYTAHLGGLADEPGCLIKVPGTVLCVETTKTEVVPTPPGGEDDTGPAGRFMCYKVKCPKAALAPLQWHDQFGDRQVTPSAPKMVFAPEIVAGTSTTTTTAATASSTTTTTLSPLGTACTGGTQCMSGFCVDGVCCNTVCSGVCTACSAAAKGQGTDGVCGNVASGFPDNNQCAVMHASTCGTTGVCNGAGACVLYSAGTACASPTCTGGVQTGASTCDGTGDCVPGTMSSCSPFICGATSCKTSCATTADCAAGFTCSGGSCVP